MTTLLSSDLTPHYTRGVLSRGADLLSMVISDSTWGKEMKSEEAQTGH